MVCNRWESIFRFEFREKTPRSYTINIMKDAPKLATLIEDSYKLYPREFVFTPKNTYPKLDKKGKSEIIR
jgi:hypothetical protein